MLDRVLALVLAFASSQAAAVNRIVLEVAEITVPGTRVGGATATLDLTNGRPVVQVRAAQMEAPSPVGTLRNVRFDCTDIYVREPKIACRGGTVSADGGPTKKISARVTGEYDTTTSTAIAEGAELPIAGGQAQFAARFEKRGWSVDGRATSLDIPQLRTLAAPLFKVPETLQLTGHVDFVGQASSRSAGLLLAGDFTTADFNLTNQEGTVVAENVAATLNATVARNGPALEVQGRIESAKGQALAGPVLVDMGVNPLTLDARGQLSGETLLLNDITLTQKDLTQARGHARVALGESPRIVLAHVDLANLQFPAAYTSFLQIGLAATDFGQLKTTGSVRGSLDMNDNAVTQLALYVSGLNMEDAKKKFSMAGVNADVFWSRDENIQVPQSKISWNNATAYGLAGGATRLEFHTRGRGFELARPARLPVFDGAVLVNTLAMRNLGLENTEMDFDATIEPISMTLLSLAFGWPSLNGQLSGAIPGLTYRNRVLTVDGDLTASVFDGTVVGRGFKLENPAGPWPRLYADVTARGLDLSLVTNTFEIGSITGRLDADINGLELFNWSPVGFDARLYSTPGDKSRRMISAKAITSISNVGGGGGTVTAALQSGVLRFFDDYRYDRIGMACRLENEVCTMSGIEQAGMGYYLVKGRGVPRIDIIGNQGRVAWPQLLAQIASGMQTAPVVR
jgi:hypothetical protein